MKKIIVAGSRDITDKEYVSRILDTYTLYDTDVIVSGGAQGVDKLGEDYANEHGLNVRIFPADWKQGGNAAGPIRNGEMAGYGDMLVAFWDGESRGTKDMIYKALGKGLETHVYIIKKDEQG